MRALRDVLAPFSGKEQWQADNDGVQGNRAEDDDDDNGQQDVETLKTRKAIGSWVPVQDALITRDGAAEKELERMRVLLARVGGRVAGLPSLEPNPDGREETAARGGVPETESFKMEKLLATF